MNMMKVVVKHPGSRKLYITKIAPTLSSMQEVVGGFIEAVPFLPDILLVCNEEGKLQGQKLNFLWRGDAIVGTVFFCGSGQDDFKSLTPAQIDAIFKYFDYDPMCTY